MKQKTITFKALLLIEFFLVCGCTSLSVIIITVLYTTWLYTVASSWRREGKLNFLDSITE